MIDRNKQQNDIMFNMNIEFGIKGIPNAQNFFREIKGILAKYGDSVRIVGFSTRKPTARVNAGTLIQLVCLDTHIDEAKDTKFDDDASDQEQEDNSEEKEDSVDDEEPNRANQA